MGNSVKTKILWNSAKHTIKYYVTYAYPILDNT